MTNPADTPWQNFGNWQDGTVSPSPWFRLALSLGTGLVSAAFFLYMLSSVNYELHGEDSPVLLLYAALIIAVIMLARFLYHLARYRKFGRLRLQLDPMPGSLGADFGASLDLPVEWHKALQARVQLTCQHTASGEKRIQTRLALGDNSNPRSGSIRTAHKILWNRDGMIPFEPSLRGSRLNIRIHLPEDMPESQKPSNDYHHWELQIYCRLPGLSLNQIFTVPVFITPQPLFSSLPVNYLKDTGQSDQPESILDDRLVQISEDRHSLQLHYPPYRKTAVYAGLIFGAVFTLLGLPLIFVAGIFIGLLFLVAGLLTLYIVIVHRLSSLDVSIDDDFVTTSRRFLKWRQNKHAPRDAIKSIRRVISSQASNQAGNTISYRIEAELDNGSKLLLGRHLVGSQITDAVEKRICERLQIPLSDSGDQTMPLDF